MAFKVINENRMLLLIPGFVKNAKLIFTELAQNAQRAGATKLDITLKDGVLTAVDNGAGAGAVEPLLTLADSDWDPAVERDHIPAGWGLFSIYSISEFVTMRSKFGELHLDSRKFLSDGIYRDGVLALIDPAKSRDGFQMEAVLQEKIAQTGLRDVTRDDIQCQLGYFPLKVSFNGQIIARNPHNEYRESVKTTYEGNDLFVSLTIPRFGAFPQSAEEFKKKLRVIWYGILIDGPAVHDSFNESVATLNVVTGSPVTPVLPYRTSIKSDDKLTELYSYVRKIVIERCIQYINNAKNTNAEALTGRMRLIAGIATQHELNRLNRFYYNVVDAYNNDETYSSRAIRKTVIVSKAEVVPCNEFVQQILIESETGVEKIGDENLILAPETFTEVYSESNKPDWFVILDQGFTIRVKVADRVYNGYFTWTDSVIECKGKDIDCVSVVEYGGCGDVYYRSDPGVFNKMSRAVFAMAVYSDDSDTYDTQFDDFERCCDNDIDNIVGAHSKFKLFDNIASAAGLGAENISAITFKNKVLTVTNKKGKKIKLKIR